MSVLGAATRLTGRVNGEGGLRVEGSIRGDVAVTGPAEIAEGGSVEGNVHAESLEVAGTLLGDVTARGPVQVRAGAVVRGELTGRARLDRTRGARGSATRHRFRAGSGDVAAPPLTRSSPTPYLKRGEMAGTVIGEGLTVEGEVTSDEEVVVHGTLRGTLSSSDAVSVGAGGIVEADINASALSVAGQITGNVSVAERVDLQAGGRLVGDVKSARLTIADGASFKGNVDMEV